MKHEATRAAIIAQLQTTFSPTSLAVLDESARHVGHAGARAGGGHFRVKIKAAGLEGLSRLEQHQRIYGALDGLMGGAIHALAIQVLAADAPPDEAPFS